MKSIRDRIENAWENKFSKMDWEGLEDVLRDILKVYKKVRAPMPPGMCSTSDRTIGMIDEAIAAFTGRGKEL